MSHGQLSLRRGLNLEKSTHYLSIYLQSIKKPKGRHMKRRGDRGVPLIENGRTKWTNKWRLDIKIKVCFCPQKRMSPPVPQTVVIGKKSIWVTNKIKLQWITKKKILIHETQNKLIKSAKASVTGTIPYCHDKVPHSRKLLSPCSNDFKGVLFF